MHITEKLEIIIDETITRIKVESDFVRLYANVEVENKETKEKEKVEKLVGTVPIYQVESVLVLGSNHNIPARLVKLTAKHRIPMHFCSSLEKYYGSLEFITDKKILTRKNQYASCLNSRASLIMAKQIVFQKILTQIKCTQMWKNWTMLEMLKGFLSQVNDCKNHGELRGVEGISSNLYWSAFEMQVRNSGFGWQGRKKNPATDPINLLLSLGYGLLATQIQTNIQLQGFDPYLGILHVSNSSRPALVYDIIEFYRCLWIDLWVIDLVQQKVFAPEDFEQKDDPTKPLKMNYKKQQLFLMLWSKRFRNQEFLLQTTNQEQKNSTLKGCLKMNLEILQNWFEIHSKKQKNYPSIGKLNYFVEIEKLAKTQKDPKIESVYA